MFVNVGLMYQWMDKNINNYVHSMVPRTL